MALLEISAMIATTTYQGGVLLVEDDPFMQGAVRDFLSDLGFTVTTASTYNDALDLIAEEDVFYRLLVADLSLPKQSLDDPSPRQLLGMRIVQRTKDQSPQTGVVIWSAYSTYLPELVEMIATGHKGLAYVPKGSRARILREAIDSVLRGDIYLHGDAISSHPSDAESLFLNVLDADVAKAVKVVAKRILQLPPRQREVVESITSRPSIMAADLGVTEKTVRNYHDIIYERLGLRDPLTGSQHLRRDPIIVLAVLLNRMQGHTK